MKDFKPKYQHIITTGYDIFIDDSDVDDSDVNDSDVNVDDY